jgi:hypothetical protein
MRWLMSALALVAMSGCSTVEVKPFDGTYKDGLRFYRPEPYLLVTKDKDGIVQSAIVYLPNKKEEYIVRAVPRLGTVDMKAALDGGWNLTSLGATIDTKIPETITALSGLAQAAAGLRGRSMTDEPGLYRIEFDSTTGRVSTITKVPIQ